MEVRRGVFDRGVCGAWGAMLRWCHGEVYVEEGF